MTASNLLFSILVTSMLVVGCGGSASPDAGRTDAPVSMDDAGPPYVPAGWTATPYLGTAPIRSFTAAGDATEDGVDYAAVITTDVGVLVVDLTESETPITVNSFVWLARNHYYDGIAFHRVVPGFVVQGGDPNTISMPRGTWGSGGPGYMFGLEIDPALRFDGAGVLGMARTPDPETNGSQFFITLAAQPGLDGMYTVFGRVIEGAAVLSAIAVGEPPPTPTRITSLAIIQR